MREIVDPLGGDGVGDPFADHNGNHVREDVFQLACEFEHDDSEGDGHAADTREEGGCTHHGEDAGVDGVEHPLTDKATAKGTGVESGDDDP